MGLEHFKRWHWIVIGLLVGAGLAYARTQFPSHPAYTVRHGMSIGQFVDLAEGRLEGNRGGGFLERLAELSRPANTHPTLLDLVIHPAVDGKQFVTGRYLGRVLHDGPRYEAFELMAPVPFIAPDAPPPLDPGYSVRDFLAANAAQVEYRYLWWKHPSLEPAIVMVASVVLIGGIWPIVLNLLIGAGFGRKAEPKEPAYDLERFGKHPEEPTAAVAAVNEDDMEKLHALEEELERNLVSRTTTSTAAGDGAASPAGAPAAVRQLSNAPVDPLQPLDRPEDPHEYRGEYYPVAHPIKHETPKTPST
jgi:hypothetical protein